MSHIKKARRNPLPAGLFETASEFAYIAELHQEELIAN
jgi:hypothetical protein